MISILFYGILVGLLPTVALAVLLALSQRDFAELESDYEQLKKQSRQLCSELEFERKKVAELKDRLAGVEATHEFERKKVAGLDAEIRRMGDEWEAAAKRADQYREMANNLAHEMNRMELERLTVG